MLTIRGKLLIVSSFTISICLLIQEPTYINQRLLIDEITFDSYTLNLISHGDSPSDFASNGNNGNHDNASLKVKTIQPIL